MEIIYMVGGAIATLAKFALLVLCIVLILKLKSNATILMLTGSVFHIIFPILNIIWTALAARNGADAIVDSVYLLNIFKNIPHVLFTIGFGVFVVRDIPKQLKNR
jgi:hypothetical protein